MENLVRSQSESTIQQAFATDQQFVGSELFEKIQVCLEELVTAYLQLSKRRKTLSTIYHSISLDQYFFGLKD